MKSRAFLPPRPARAAPGHEAFSDIHNLLSTAERELAAMGINANSDVPELVRVGTLLRAARTVALNSAGVLSWA